MPRPRSYRTPAIILKRRDMGEADRLVTMFTPFHGKIEAIARGARKPASTKTGHVELYTRADVLIAKGRDIDMLSQVEMTEPYLPLREDLMKSACASYVVELLDRFTFSDDIDVQGLFRLLDETLVRLCSDDDLRLVVRYYELNLLDEAGFRPELQECVMTHDMLLPVDQFFSYGDGGVVSPEGAHHSAGLVPLPMNTLKLLRHLQRSPYKQVAKLKVNDATHANAEYIMQGYIRYVLEHQPRSADFMRRVRRMDKERESSESQAVKDRDE
jgi:DNA repair protein RecO (recombination protein O)